MINWSKYIGIPFKDMGRDFNGVDCGGLVMLAYKEETGRRIPDFDGKYIARQTRQAGKGIEYVRDASFRKIDGPEHMAVAIFSRNGLPYHVALCIDNERVIHAKEGEHVKCQRLDEIADCHCLEGFYIAI